MLELLFLDKDQRKGVVFLCISMGLRNGCYFFIFIVFVDGYGSVFMCQ